MPDPAPADSEGASEGPTAGAFSGIAAGGQPSSAGGESGASQRTAPGTSQSGNSPQPADRSVGTPPPGGVSAANTSVIGGTQANVSPTPPKTNASLESNPSSPPMISLSNEPASNQPPVRSLNLRVEGQSGETVNVRLTDRAGQIQVSVSSSDSRTAASLQQDLATLSSNLEKVGWKAEQPAPAPSLKNSDASADQQSRQHNQRQSSGESDEQSGRRRPSLIEQWVELANPENG